MLTITHDEITRLSPEERLTLIGTAALEGTGNELANLIIGNAGSNVIDGRGGDDTMEGGGGNDAYFVDSMAATVVEQAAETLIQEHGGIGFTWEHDAHLYWRRAKVDRLLLGDAVAAFDTVARLALAAAAPSS